MPLKVKENKMVSAYLLFFLIHSSQTGIGVLKFQTEIIKGAAQDAWLSVLIVGLSMHILFFMILHIIRHSSQGDLISFHTDIFGKFLGGILNMMVVIYFFAVGLVAIQSYVDILDIWVFDGIPVWEFTLLICVIIYYLVSGGFRIITGVAFWGTVIPPFLLLSIIYLFTLSDYTYIMPFFNHSFKDYLISARESGFMYFGFETALVFFPFIKNGMKSSKWGHLALLYTTIIYVIVTFLTFTYFTQGKLEHLAWPTLSMIQIIQLPFMERFEFIFIFTWLLVVIPVVCIYLWASTRIIKLTFSKLKPTYVLFGLIGSYFLIVSIVVDLSTKKILEKAVSYFGLAFLFGYIPLLFIISLIKSMKDKRKQKLQGNLANSET